ncbi:MAG: T9SS type A sorting domain-containing protein [Tannerellaceae bacterium]|jgi:hypothetical protein|nr:T9SS type A sorting domain-containing protein [Tannerellaceae bacterium]
MKRHLLLLALLITGICASAQPVSTKVSKTRKAHVNHAQQATATRVEKKVMEKRSPFADSKVKEVISSKKMKDGSVYRTVKLDNGMVKKQWLNPSKKLQSKIAIPRPKAGVLVAAEGSFFEGFEGWDGETLDWIPEGWVDESKENTPSNLVDAAGDVYNFTWQTTEGGGLGQTPTEGIYSAFIQFSTFYLTDDEENPVAPATHQDEWLISPSVTIDRPDYVWDFDMYYDPFWSLLDYETMEFGELRTVVEALISTDNGATWTKKWDNRANAAQYTEDELWNFILEEPAPWVKVTIDLSEYAGQTIKTAIRYINDDGESAYVDAVTIGYPPLEVSYRRPGGYLISGFSEDYYLLNANIIVGNAYTPTQWKANVKNADAVSWDFGGTIFNETNPIITLPYELYDTPVLSASNAGGTAEFQLGVEGEDNYMLLGGTNTWDVEEEEPKSFGLGNYDIQYRFTYYSDLNAEGFPEYTFKGAANYFEKPTGKYIFETLNVHAGNVVAKEGEPVKLEIYAMDNEGRKGRLLASSEAYPDDFIVGEVDDGYIYHTVPFKFKEVDPETGREEDTYLEINSAFIAEFTNYESADVFFQYEDHPTGDNYGYGVFEEGYLSLGATSALFDLDASFPFLVTETNDESETGNKYAAPDEGGTKEFKITTLWTPEGWWLEEELPDWIELGEPVSDGTGVVTLPVTVAPLPSLASLANRAIVASPDGVTGRNADIKLVSYGCSLTLKIKQGDASYTGISTIVRTSAVKAVRQGDTFLLSYPNGTTAVAVYTLAGQKVSEHTLNASGRYTLPAADLSKGVYLLKFSGKTTETLKVIK